MLDLLSKDFIFCSQMIASSFQTVTQHVVLLLQKAIKEQNLNLDEIDKQVLGTDNEKQNPNVEKPSEQTNN